MAADCQIRGAEYKVTETCGGLQKALDHSNHQTINLSDPIEDENIE